MSTVLPASQAPSQPPPAQSANPLLLAALQSGAAIRAVVQGMVADTLMRLQLPTGTLDVATAKALPAGTPVEVTVSGTQALPQVTVRALPESAAQSGPAAARTPQTAPPSVPSAGAAAPRPDARPEARSEALLQTAAAAVIRQAAAKQGGLAPLYADVEEVLTRPGTPLPAPVRAAATQLLALRLSPAPGGEVDAPALKDALMRAGLDRHVASGPQAGPAAPALKPALMALRDALRAWVELESSLPATARPQPPSQSQPQPPTAQAAPPPPHRGAPSVPQAPVPATLPGDAPAREIALHLLRDTEAALARQTLLQIASLPEKPGATQRGESGGARLTFEIPVATPNGTAIAQVRIEEDETARRDGSDRDGAPVWRADFSIAVEPIGPVHVRIALAGERAAVTLRAERPDSATRLASDLPLLEAGLRNAALEPGELRCRGGAPAPAAAAGPGQFLDRAS